MWMTTMVVIDRGVSIGSLGKGYQEQGVQNVTVKTVMFTGTQNGLWIKTWGRPSDGFVKGVVFEHAMMQNVDNPIIITQSYCPGNKNCPDQNSGVKISQVTYSDIHGSSATPIAVDFNCSPTNLAAVSTYKTSSLLMGVNQRGLLVNTPTGALLASSVHPVVSDKLIVY